MRSSIAALRFLIANRNEDLDVTIPSNHPAALPTPPIGFIGLGIMGQPMALNLRQAGYPLFVHARRAESMAPLVAAAGAIGCITPAEVARQVEFLFTMVADTAEV